MSNWQVYGTSYVFVPVAVRYVLFVLRKQQSIIVNSRSRAEVPVSRRDDIQLLHLIISDTSRTRVSWSRDCGAFSRPKKISLVITLRQCLQPFLCQLMH